MGDRWVVRRSDGQYYVQTQEYLHSRWTRTQRYAYRFESRPYRATVDDLCGHLGGRVVRLVAKRRADDAMPAALRRADVAAAARNVARCFRDDVGLALQMLAQELEAGGE